MIRNILLASDGSPHSARATDFAASLAKRFQAKVTVLHAYIPDPGPLGNSVYYGEASYKTGDQAKAFASSVVRRLNELGVSQVGVEIMEGPAANVILGVAETLKPDIIVMGARGLSTWQGILLGSVSNAVTQRSELPVLIVK